MQLHWWHLQFPFGFLCNMDTGTYDERNIFSSVVWIIRTWSHIILSTNGTIRYILEALRCRHRSNIELDLQSLFGLHVTWCAQLFSLAETLQHPPPPAFGLIYDGRYWSAIAFNNFGLIEIIKTNFIIFAITFVKIKLFFYWETFRYSYSTYVFIQWHFCQNCIILQIFSQ